MMELSRCCRDILAQAGRIGKARGPFIPWLKPRGFLALFQCKLYLSRRKPGSAWSKANKDRVATLRARGLMTPAGELAVARAQASGAWDRLDASDKFELPPELVQQLEATPAARAFFDSLPPSSHRIILEWIYAARTQETRLKRITETVQLAAQGIKAHHYRQ